MYQALYRKYRPKTFSEVVGQQHITDTLQRQVADGQVGHATCSPVPAAPARPPVPVFWPRPSTVSTPLTARPATSAPPAAALTTAHCWM